MDAIYGSDGKVKAWRDGDRLLTPEGKALAFLVGSSVYDYNARHRGWWMDDDWIMGHDGGVIGACESAYQLPVAKPKPQRVPQPIAEKELIRPPDLETQPPLPHVQRMWSSRGLY